MKLDKRKFFTLFLVAYLMAFSAPFLVTADEIDDYFWSEAGSQCQLPGGKSPFIITSSDFNKAKDEAYQTWAKEVQIAYEEAYDKNDDGKHDEDDTECGTTNEATHLVEKADCTADGSIVTELTEPVAPTVKLDEDTYVIDVFKGECCIALYNDPETGEISCDDVRSIYTLEYDDCTANGVHCSQRQWLIAKSGTGLLKLFVKQIYTWGAFAVGSIAVGTIIFNGIKISMSGVSGDLSDAKNKIFQAIAGIVLLFLSSLLLYTINPDFFG